LPGAVAVAADTLDGLAARLGAAGIDLDALMMAVLRAVEVATAPRAVNGLASVESRLLEPARSRPSASWRWRWRHHRAAGRPWGMLKALRSRRPARARLRARDRPQLRPAARGRGCRRVP
jgi:hypothetical protein